MDHQRGASPDGHNLHFNLPQEMQYTPCGKNHTYHPEDWPSSGEIAIEKCERQCRFRGCKAWSQTAAALRKHVNKHIQHNSLPLKIVPASSGRTPLKIIIGRDLDPSPYDSLESLANAAVQDAHPSTSPVHPHILEGMNPKSPITIYPPSSITQQQTLFKDVGDEEQRIVRTALSVLGHKMAGKSVDVHDLARRIVGDGPSLLSSSGDDEQEVITTALIMLGHKMTGKLEDVNDLARRIVGDVPSTWGSSVPSHEAGNSPIKSSFPALTEPFHHSQTFDPSAVLQLPKEPAPVQPTVQDSESDMQSWFESNSSPWIPKEIHEAGTTSAHSPLKCATCHKSVKTRSELKKHDIGHRKPFLYQCSGCIRTDGFSTTNDLDGHTKAHRPLANQFSVPKKRYRCHLDGCRSKERSWPRMENFRSHLRRVHSHTVISDEIYEEYIRRGEYWEDDSTISGKGLDLRPLHVLADSAASVR